MEVYYLIESRWASLSSLKISLKEDFSDIINDLARRGIYKEEKNSYRIEYVGIMSFNNIVLVVLPKFLNEEILLDERRCEKELTLIVKVLKKASKKSLEDFLYSSSLESDENLTNRLALIEELFQDFSEYGLYNKDKHCYELNGNGGIDWEPTIEEEQAHYINDTPYYLNLHTNNIDPDESHYIKKLHQYVLLKAKDEILDFPLKTIVEELIYIPNFNFSFDENVLNDLDFMITSIDNELKEVFNERKVRLLKKMKLFLNREESSSQSSIKLWGVNKFWAIWENICKIIFNDQSKVLNKLISKPIYKGMHCDYENTRETLIPDVLTVKSNNLFILDAKYYDFKFTRDGLLKGNPPGLESITKQFAYVLAFKDRNYSKIYNCFCIPTEENETKVIGEIEFDIYNLEPIKILQLSYEEVFNMYLLNKKFPENFLIQNFYNINEKL